MLKVNEFKFYELASVIHPLTSLPDVIHYGDVFWGWFEARNLLDQIFRDRPLAVATQSALRLYNAIGAVVPKGFTAALDKMAGAEALAEDPDADLVSSYLIYEIREAAKQFETVLSAETFVLDTYLVSQKGSYRTSDLIDRAEIIFPENIRSLLPDITIADIQQAGRCIALDIPTGAAFHLMRAVESVMAMYYMRVIGKPIPTRMRNWGVYIRELRKSGKASDKIVGFLEHIKDTYRNPTAHPDVIVTGDEAEILLGVAAASIRQIVLEVRRLDKEAETTATAPMLTATVAEMIEARVDIAAPAPATPTSITTHTKGTGDVPL